MPRSDQTGQSPEIPGGDIQGTATDTLEQASSDLTDLKTGAADVATQVADAATAESGAGDLADGVGLDAEDALATGGLPILAILTFSAMAHLFKLAFGTAGSLLLAVLLMLQLTSAGGLYPVETTPEFFQALPPPLPMSYVVDTLRVTISGGEASHVVRALLVLGASLVGTLAASSPVVAGRRRWRPDSLHPSLQI